MDDEDISEKLDAIIELLAIDKKECLEDLVDNLEDVERQILASTAEWTAPVEFKEEIAEEVGVSPRTVINRAQDLEEVGLLESKGSGNGKTYKRDSLFSHVRGLKRRINQEE